ncbi:tryptophan halogenase family protein [Pseudoalteromonas fuliginea]|uniref:tryptophan halogenase family protein n=1 Tax=Pseudoalteromonas TaxID=53246 RepID=UPI0002AA73B8|nr:tryptophan halogenase family protein [Pseudoalteromonas sp. Bsw20308]ALQ08249.1 tryptophan halogenase [Pseudoalteromonas sp. Bsw20308]
MNDDIKSIVIVGGGTAGWLSAGIIAAYLQKHHSKKINITLLESSDIPTVGVGEGTWPTMRRTLKDMGIRETEFIKKCNVSFKQGAKFAKWVTGENDDYYYHPLELPTGMFENNLATSWLNINNAQPPFAQYVSAQQSICESGLAPKQITTPEFSAIANYAYHLDAGLFATFLKNHCIDNLNVKHIVGTVVGVNNCTNGDIKSVSLNNKIEIAGDLFIDCSGFKSLLLGENLGVGFKSCKDVLFADSALAIHMPYKDDEPICSHTLSTAQTSGWIWDIGLQTRRGVGHVYASNYISDDEAKQQLFDYLNINQAQQSKYKVKKLTFEPGHREKFWHKNCVAIGLSAGFLEPLEASALLLVEISAKFVAEQFPYNECLMAITAERFNRTFSYRWARIIDFLKLHYILSKRTDSPFWQAHCCTQTIPQSLKDNLAIWTFHTPSDNHFDHSQEVFPAASYQYVLYGMGFLSSTELHNNPDCYFKKAQALVNNNLRHTEQLLKKLPTNNALLEQIKQFGMQQI